MGTVRLGKRTEGRSPQIKDFVPLAALDDVVFGGWDIFEENCVRGGQDRRRARRRAAAADPSRARSRQADVGGVRSPLRQAARRPQREEGRQQARARRPAARGHPPLQGGQQARPPRHDLVRQHRGLPDRVGGARDRRELREGARSQRPGDSLEHGLRLRGHQGGDSLRERRAEPQRRRPRVAGAGAEDRVAARRQGSQDRADLDEDADRPGHQGAAARRRGLVFDQHPRQSRRRSARRSGVVQDEGREQEVGARLHPSAERSIPTSTRSCATSSASTTTRRAATTRKAGTTSTSSAGSATRCS